MVNDALKLEQERRSKSSNGPSQQPKDDFQSLAFPMYKYNLHFQSPISFIERLESINSIYLDLGKVDGYVDGAYILLHQKLQWDNSIFVGESRNTEIVFLEIVYEQMHLTRYEDIEYMYDFNHLHYFIDNYNQNNVN